jgi:hypothetical protein
MTESEAKAAAERLKPDFPVAEAVQVSESNGHRFWAVKTYGTPPFLESTKSIGAFIASKITEPHLIP